MHWNIWSLEVVKLKEMESSGGTIIRNGPIGCKLYGIRKVDM